MKQSIAINFALLLLPFRSFPDIARSTLDGSRFVYPLRLATIFRCHSRDAMPIVFTVFIPMFSFACVEPPRI